MNWQVFSWIGYLSVFLWVGVPVLWVLHWWRRPRRWLAHVALAVGVVAFILARVNSASYVNRIEEDRSEQIARAAKAIEEEQKRKEEERSEDIADKRFAEDSRSDYLDEGGMTEADRAYYGSSQVGTPAWKQEKQQRTIGPDGSLEGAIGAVEDTDGVDATTFEEDAPASVVLSVDDKQLADRLDALNLDIIRLLLVFGCLFLLHDYVSRFNAYDEAYLPLPLPSRWVNGVTPLAAVRTRPASPRRERLEELAVLIRRGDSFLYLTDDAEMAQAVPDALYRLPLKRGPVEVLPTVMDGRSVSPDFIFEALWFGRCAFVQTDSARVEALLCRVTELLVARRASRARARQSVHLIWDRADPVPAVFRANMEILGPATGVTLFEFARDED